MYERFANELAEVLRFSSTELSISPVRGGIKKPPKKSKNHIMKPKSALSLMKGMGTITMEHIQPI